MRLFTFLATILVTPALIAAAPPARMPIASFEQLAKPLPLPYDETANADAAVAAAKVRALRHHKLLLIDLGGNWCLDCRILAGAMEVPALKTWLAKYYEVVDVDVGRFDKNLEIPRRYGVDKELVQGVPALLIVDPRTDKLANKGKVAALEDARSMTPQAIADWLAQWVK